MLRQTGELLWGLASELITKASSVASGTTQPLRRVTQNLGGGSIPQVVSPLP